MLREEVAPEEVHGNYSVGQCREVDHRLISRVDPGCPGVRPEGLLYMDTETSGLGQGALAFCVGIGFWQNETFVVEQLLLESSDPAGERAMLAYFAEMLRERHMLVTFNGRRFDVPLLARRYARHQMSDPFGGRQHLDLLPTARRHFVGRKRYKLSSLEEDVLNFHRVDDVPGREIPALWQRFERGEAVPKMAGMLEHNRHDIVSMAALLAAQIEAVGGFSTSSTRGASAGTSSVRGVSGAVSRAERGSQSAGDEAFGRASSGGSRVSEVASRLERTYRLRSSFSESSGRRSDGAGLSAERPEGRADAGDGATVGRTTGRDFGAKRATEGRASASERTDNYGSPGSGESEDPNLKERVRSLRAAARAMIDAQLFHQAAPTLFELVALAPDDRFGLQMLARYYRQAGETQLAEVMEARFRSAGGG
ncbi:ribonuclease H-like domain-containing protein [Lujinxingia vulgaris]|uniref:ribonuclease H-like domain-containing protein n=1 Tax=Lujinxingia vulgaris TaxID=2600176 RepID=UPI001E47CB10|nr:ribonuclease H-like domain-containing protein [Lujinxingia vulgaris]